MSHCIQGSIIYFTVEPEIIHSLQGSSYVNAAQICHCYTVIDHISQ